MNETEETEIDYRDPDLWIRSGSFYVLLCIHDHPNSDRNGYIFEHRVVAEMYCGRFLKSGEDVHHKNEIKHDNRIENLEIISHSEHTILHNLGSVQSEATRRKMSDKAKKRFSNKKNHPFYKDVDDELIEMIKDGKKPTEISKKLNITRKTVKLGNHKTTASQISHGSQSRSVSMMIHYHFKEFL